MAQKVKGEEEVGAPQGDGIGSRIEESRTG
jgi:hypothetical protein